MKHLKKFENFNNSELVEEGIFGINHKKLISKIDSLDTNNEQSVKDVFISVFSEANTKSDMGIKYWNKIKTNIDKFKKDDMIKVLNELKSDYSNNKAFGYVVNIGTELNYKAASKIKAASIHAGGGGSASLGS